jgi:hypothetical protein
MKQQTPSERAKGTDAALMRTKNGAAPRAASLPTWSRIEYDET